MKVRTTIELRVLEDGNVVMRVAGEASAAMSDLILASGYLVLETQHQHGKMKVAQAVAADRRILPVSAVPDLNGVPRG